MLLPTQLPVALTPVTGIATRLLCTPTPIDATFLATTYTILADRAMYLCKYSEKPNMISGGTLFYRQASKTVSSLFGRSRISMCDHDRAATTVRQWQRRPRQHQDGCMSGCGRSNHSTSSYVRSHRGRKEQPRTNSRSTSVRRGICCITWQGRPLPQQEWRWQDSRSRVARV